MYFNFNNEELMFMFGLYTSKRYQCIPDLDNLLEHKIIKEKVFTGHYILLHDGIFIIETLILEMIGLKLNQQMLCELHDMTKEQFITFKNKIEKYRKQFVIRPTLTDEEKAFIKKHNDSLAFVDKKIVKDFIILESIINKGYFVANKNHKEMVFIERA